MKVMVIGSGPIVIGQAAEFDYAGTQACKSLKEEGCEVVLINSNPATIMTDPGVSDALYIEPLNVDFCERVIARERPDALLPTLGGQTGLNLAIQLSDAGILDRYNVRLLGTPLSAIRKAEDREEFRTLMREIKEPVPESFIVENEDQLRAILPVEIPDENGRLMEFPYPRIVRPAYTLGGTGGGVATTPEELWEIGRKGLKLSMRSQLMIERSLLGWKEIEYEVMRDSAGCCITVCNMENFDPMGVHTGDSIVVAPSQTLSDLEYHMMRTAALKIINALGIEGGCNVQMALNPESFDYYIIEVNPRVSRSSALASKATGYPIARVAAKIAIGKTLDQIDNEVTGVTKACFEPALDYCVVKIPRWPFDKFASGDRTLFTQMKATGEVMAIDRSFEAALMKAVRGLEVKQKDLWHEKFGGTRSNATDLGDTGFQPVRVSGIMPEEPIQGDKGFQPVRVSGIMPENPMQTSPDNEEPIAFDKDNDIEVRYGAYLPHWTRHGAVYHVVFRLADSVPRTVLDEWAADRDTILKKSDLTDVDRLKLIRLLSQRIDTFLDSGMGSCVLNEPTSREILNDSLRHFDNTRYQLLASCVMPNHVHAIVQPIGEHLLADIMHSWKSFTANKINQSCNRAGGLWAPEYYDHLIRSESKLWNFVRYIENNPTKANLLPLDRVWVGDIRGLFQLHDGGPGLEAQATHGLEARVTNGNPPMPDFDLQAAIRQPTDERLWAIAEGLRRGWTIEEVNRLCKVDPWFLAKMKNIIDQESQSQLDAESWVVYKMVDTCAAEFESATPYYYATHEVEDDAIHVRP